MREIIPERLWLGNAGDGRDSNRLLQAGVVAAVDLAMEEPSPVLPRSMIYCRFPLVDGTQDNRSVLRMAIRMLVSLLKNGIPSLVFCGAGMSRSPAVVAAALAVVEEETPEVQLRRIASGHPHDVSPQLWKDVCTAWAEITTARDNA